jgi:hypothetical protein
MKMRNRGLSAFLRRPAVAQLFRVGGPFAVLWTVGAIIVNAFNGEARRALTHIGQKRLKALTPPLADINTARAVIAIGWVVGVFASGYHGGPASVFRSLAESMRPLNAAHVVALVAPTGFSESSAQHASGNASGATAIALTAPKRFWFGQDIFRGDETAKALASKVEGFSTDPLLFHRDSLAPSIVSYQEKA